MQLAEGISIASFVLATVGFMFKMTRDVAEIKKQVINDIQHIAKEEDTKHARIYERLDEHKKFSDETFVRRDMCQILHKQNADTLLRIEKKVDDLISNKT